MFVLGPVNGDDEILVQGQVPMTAQIAPLRVVLCISTRNTEHRHCPSVRFHGYANNSRSRQGHSKIVTSFCSRFIKVFCCILCKICVCWEGNSDSHLISVSTANDFSLK